MRSTDIRCLEQGGEGMGGGGEGQVEEGGEGTEGVERVRCWRGGEEGGGRRSRDGRGWRG